MRFKSQNETCKTTPAWEGQQHEIKQDGHDDLIDLQCQVLDALENAMHPEYEAASNDPALGDLATISQRKAWLAIYGPLTDVLPSID